MKLYIREDPLAKYAFSLPQSVVDTCNKLGYTELPPHLHEVVFFLSLYSGIYVLSGLICPHVYPAYNKLTKRNQINFDMHVVSHIQAFVLCACAWAIYFDPALDHLTASTPFSSMSAAAAIGYFIWDLYVSLRHVDMFGMPFLAHAGAALFTFIQASRPFMHNYAAPFMLYEMSTPFVNIHWFASHVPGMIPSGWHKINGLMLLAAFFVFRIVLGSYYGFKLFSEAFKNPPVGIPAWCVYAVVTMYLTLTLLNFIWFSKMIKLAAKALRGSKKKGE